MDFREVQETAWLHFPFLDRAVSWRSWVLLLGLAVLGALIAYAGTLHPTPTLSPLNQPAPPLVLNATHTSPFSLVPTQLPSPSLAASTTTLSPLVTDTMIPPTSPTPGPLLETPFGPQGTYLVYLVKAGESFEILSQIYNTTPAVLKTTNRRVAERGLWAGEVVVVLPGVTDNSGLVPMEALWLEADAQLSQLVVQFGMDAETLRQTNDLGLGEAVAGGRWLVIMAK